MSSASDLANFDYDDLAYFFTSIFIHVFLKEIMRNKSPPFQADIACVKEICMKRALAAITLTSHNALFFSCPSIHIDKGELQKGCTMKREKANYPKCCPDIVCPRKP